MQGYFSGADFLKMDRSENNIEASEMGYRTRGGMHMEHTEAKQAMKELTMALLYLSRFCEREKFAEAEHFYAWKGYDFDVLNELDDEDLIRQGSHRSKSVYLTEAGKEYTRSLLEKYDIDDWKGTTA